MHTAQDLDKRYNKIQSNYPWEHLLEEATYVLEESTTVENQYLFQKKPDDCPLVMLPNLSSVNDFIADKDGVLLIRASGTYSRYNYSVEVTSDDESDDDELLEATIDNAEIDKSVVG